MYLSIPGVICQDGIRPLPCSVVQVPYRERDAGTCGAAATRINKAELRILGCDLEKDRTPAAESRPYRFLCPTENLQLLILSRSVIDDLGDPLCYQLRKGMITAGFYCLDDF